MDEPAPAEEPPSTIEVSMDEPAPAEAEPPSTIEVSMDEPAEPSIEINMEEADAMPSPFDAPKPPAELTPLSDVVHGEPTADGGEAVPELDPMAVDVNVALEGVAVGEPEPEPEPVEEGLGVHIGGGGSSSVDEVSGSIEVAPGPDSLGVHVTSTEGAPVEDEIPLGAPIGEPKVVEEGESAVASPWDSMSAATDAVDLDASPQDPSVFDMLLAAEKNDEERSGEYARPDLTAAAEPEAPAEPEPQPEPEAPTVAEECANLMSGALELFELGDFSGSLGLIEKVLELDADNAGAREYLQRNESTLIQMYESKLGDLNHTPQLRTSPDEVIWMNLHHRAGFLLSQVDGMISYEDLAAISGMTRLETFRILADLVGNGVIG
jgi:hypothetical protein